MNQTNYQEVKRLFDEWQEAVRRGRPDRFAKQKAFLAKRKFFLNTLRGVAS